MRGDARPFWFARFARIYPVYLVALIVAAPIFVHAARRPPQPSAATTLAAALSTPVLLQAWIPGAAYSWNCPGWTLSVEAFFYALFPLIGVWPWVVRRALGIEHSVPILRRGSKGR